jgi:hypothetical protein
LREGENPVKQKIRMMNPKLKPLVNIELEKLKKAGIIYPIIWCLIESKEILVCCDSRQTIGPYCMQGRDLHRSGKN